MEKYPFPIDRSFYLESRRTVRVKLYYGSVHYGSPTDVTNEVGQQVICVEDRFKFKGTLSIEMLNEFSRKLFPKLEKEVLDFWSKYPKAHIELYGTIPHVIVSDNGLGYWDRSDYIKVDKIIPQDTVNFHW